MKTTADATHFQGVGPQSCGTVFRVLEFDSNNHITPLVFTHLVGTESEDTWGPVLIALKMGTGLDVVRCTTIVDQQKLSTSRLEIYLRIRDCYWTCCT